MRPSRFEKTKEDGSVVEFAFLNSYKTNPPPAGHVFYYMTTCMRFVKSPGCSKSRMDASRSVSFILHCGMDRVEMIVADGEQSYESVDDFPRALVRSVEDVRNLIETFF